MTNIWKHTVQSIGLTLTNALNDPYADAFYGHAFHPEGSTDEADQNSENSKYESEDSLNWK